MRKGILLAALEELNDELDPEVSEEEIDGFDDETTPDTMMVAVLEDEAEIDEDLFNIATMEDGLDETEATIERLFNIAVTIEQYGISGPMMMAADPHRELVALKVCPAYEELEDIPVKDEVAINAADGIKEVAVEAAKQAANISGKIANTASKNAASKVAEAGASVDAAVAETKGIIGLSIPGLPATGTIVGLTTTGYLAAAAILLAGAALIKLAVIIRKMVQSQKIFLVMASKTLSANKEFDDEKFGSIEVTGYSKTTFQAAVKAGQRIVEFVNDEKLLGIANDLDAIINSSEPTEEKLSAVVKKVGDNLKPLANDKAILDIFGLTIDTEASGLPSIIINTPSIFPAKKKLSELGWKAGDVKSAVDEVLTLTKSIDGIEKTIGESIKLISKVIGTLKKQAKADANLSPVVKQAIGDVRKALELNRIIIKAAVSGIYRVNSTVVRIANAAIRTGK